MMPLDIYQFLSFFFGKNDDACLSIDVWHQTHLKNEESRKLQDLRKFLLASMDEAPLFMLSSLLVLCCV